MTTERTNQLNTKANHIERDEIVCVQCAWARALARALKHRSKWIKIVQVQVEWDASKINSRWCFCGKQISRCFSFLSICKWYLWQKFIAHFSPSLVLFLLFFRLFNLFHILLFFFIFFVISHFCCSMLRLIYKSLSACTTELCFHAKKQQH